MLRAASIQEVNWGLLTASRPLDRSVSRSVSIVLADAFPMKEVGKTEELRDEQKGKRNAQDKLASASV